MEDFKKNFASERTKMGKEGKGNNIFIRTEAKENRKLCETQGGNQILHQCKLEYWLTSLFDM